jgi:transposase
MAKPVLDEDLWRLIEPILPELKSPSRRGGRPQLSNRQTLTGILFVLRTGIPWEYLPQEMGCGSGMSCWRRLRDWNQAGMWMRLHGILLDRLQAADKIDWSRAVIDSASVRAMHRGKKRDRAPWTAANTGRNTICSSMAQDACRWPSRPRRPIGMT